MKLPSIFQGITIGLIIIGAFLRLYNLGSLPASMHRDETAIGFNAYSLLETGKDEHGESWPTSFRSFGDYKLPGLIYTTIPFVKFLGLNEWAVRLPTALFAILSLPLVYWLVRELGWSARISLIAMGITSLSFWHIAQARNAYEPMAGLFWSVLAWVCFLRARKKAVWFVGAVLGYLGGSLFYNVPWMLLPVLFLGTVLIDRREYLSKKLAVGVGLLSVFLIAISMGFLFKDVSANKTETTVFTQEEIVENSKNAVHASLVAGIPSKLSRISNHVLLWGGTRVARNYFSAFDPTYLFFAGDHNPWHNLRSIELGNMNPGLLIPFLTSLCLFVKWQRKLKVRLTGLYLFLSPVVSSLTIDAPITNRLMDFHLAVVVVTAVGVAWLFENLWKKKEKPWLFLALTGLYLGFLTIFLLRYFLIFNHTMSIAWNPKIKEMVAETNINAPRYDRVYVSNSLDLGYIYFAFYTPFEPGKFINESLWQVSGFEQVKNFGEFRFENYYGWAHLIADEPDLVNEGHLRKVLVVDLGKPEPTETEKIVFEIENWQGKTLWYGWESCFDGVNIVDCASLE